MIYISLHSGWSAPYSSKLKNNHREAIFLPITYIAEKPTSDESELIIRGTQEPAAVRGG